MQWVLLYDDFGKGEKQGIPFDVSQSLTEKGLNNGVASHTEKNSDRLLSNTNINIIKHYEDISCFLEPDLVIKEFIELLSSIDYGSDIENLLE